MQCTCLEPRKNYVAGSGCILWAWPNKVARYESLKARELAKLIIYRLRNPNFPHVFWRLVFWKEKWGRGKSWEIGIWRWAIRRKAIRAAVCRHDWLASRNVAHTAPRGTHVNARERPVDADVIIDSLWRRKTLTAVIATCLITSVAS